MLKQRVASSCTPKLRALASMSSPDEDQLSVDRVRAEMRRAHNAGASLQDAANSAGVTPQAIRDFMGGTEPQKLNVEGLASWLVRRWEATRDERRSLAHLLRWMADVVERGTPIPEVRFGEPADLPDIPKSQRGEDPSTTRSDGAGAAGQGGGEADGDSE